MSGEDTGQGGRPYGPAARLGLVADLADELRMLRRDVRRLDDIVGESAGLLAETIPKVRNLEEHVARLRGHVNALIAAAEDTAAEDPALDEAKAALGLYPDPPGPWCWPLFTADQAEKAWTALARWVAGMFVPTFAVTRDQLVDCWSKHPEMVVELSWLRLAYLEAHQPGAESVYAQSWHLRCLPAVLAAIAVAIPRTGHGPGSEPLCGPGHHLAPANRTDPDYLHAPQQLASAEHWHSAWQDAMTSDLARRRPAPQG